MKTVVFSSFSNGENTHMACCEKYKPYILKYKALILKYVPCIFDCDMCVKNNDLQKKLFSLLQKVYLPCFISFYEKKILCSVFL